MFTVGFVGLLGSCPIMNPLGETYAAAFRLYLPCLVFWVATASYSLVQVVVTHNIAVTYLVLACAAMFSLTYILRAVSCFLGKKGLSGFSLVGIAGLRIARGVVARIEGVGEGAISYQELIGFVVSGSCVLLLVVVFLLVTKARY